MYFSSYQKQLLLNAAIANHLPKGSTKSCHKKVRKERDSKTHTVEVDRPTQLMYLYLDFGLSHITEWMTYDQECPDNLVEIKSREKEWLFLHQNCTGGSTGQVELFSLCGNLN